MLIYDFKKADVPVIVLRTIQFYVIFQGAATEQKD